MKANLIRDRLRRIFTPILVILSFVYSILMTLRAWFYLVGVFPSESSGTFVVSIGNLQAGGTGKTPTVEFFAKRWSPKLRLGIVSRGYGRSSEGSKRVNSEIANSATVFGDEPTLLAHVLGPSIPIQVGEKRLVAARDLAVAEGVKLILLDDGFQHLSLRRSFDIVLADCSADSWQWHVLPWGRLREPVSALRRADLIVLTKTESVETSILDAFEKKIGIWSQAKQPILRFVQALTLPESVAGERLIVAAGLADSDHFFEMVKRSLLRPLVVATRAFADHHRYNSADVLSLTELARSMNVNKILVTEKDSVKLTPLWKETGVTDIELVVSRLEVQPAREFDKEQLERLDEIILSQVRGTSGFRDQLSDRVPAT